MRGFNKNDRGERMMGGMGGRGKRNRLFGLLYGLGMYISGVLGGM
ncbi:hypothetical protein [Staphylococcus epidermidis]